MTTSIKKRETLTDRVTGQLERAIITGELPPLSRLKSVRELAKTFGVSHKIITFALDRLEEQKLIVRKERSGVFVSATASAPLVTEVLIFVFGNDPKKGFAKMVCDVVASSAAKGKFDFFTRFVTLPYETEANRDEFVRRLDAEIAKLTKQIYAEVALVIASTFIHDDIVKCLELPFPLLFVGDFADGDFPDLNYNRIGTSHDYFSSALLWASRQGAKRVALLYSSQPQRGGYFAEALQLLVKTAAQASVDLLLLGVADMHSSDISKKQSAIDAAVAELKISGGADALILDHISPLPYLVEVLRKEGFSPLTSALPLISTGNRDFLPGWKYVQPQASAIDAFHQRLCELMLALKRGELINHREQFDLEMGREIV